MPQQPIYAQIADSLRADISAGKLGGNLPLPSDVALQERFGKVSRNAVRQALELLRREGLIYTVHRRGSYVSPQLPTRVLDITRYRDMARAAAAGAHLPAAATGRDPWTPALTDVDITECPAVPEVAALFAVDEGTPLLRRDLVWRIGGYPAQMTRSYLLLDMVSGTTVATSASEPAPAGPIGHLAHVGVTVSRVEERTTARMPTDREVAVLQIPAEAPVIAQTVLMSTADGRVVAVADEIVAPARGVVVVGAIDLMPSGPDSKLS